MLQTPAATRKPVAVDVAFHFAWTMALIVFVLHVPPHRVPLWHRESAEIDLVAFGQAEIIGAVHESLPATQTGAAW